MSAKLTSSISKDLQQIIHSPTFSIIYLSCHVINLHVEKENVADLISVEVMEEILDIGCGASSGHQLQLLDKKGVIHIDIRITDFNKQIINVQCDANSLPFREKVFVLSYCSHTLEHVTNPLKVLKEIKRVTKRKAIIKVPSIQGVIDKEAPSHFFTWSKYSLRNILNLVFDKVEVFESYRPYKSALSQLPILSRTALSIMHTLVKNELTAVCEV